MTPVQRWGLVEMTLKHGTPHSAPVKCLKEAFSTPSQPAGESLTPTLLAPLPAASIYAVMASVHVTYFLCRYTLLWSNAPNVSSEQQPHASHRGARTSSFLLIVHMSEYSMPLGSVALPQGVSRLAARVCSKESVHQ